MNASLENAGTTILRPKELAGADPATVIIVGVARSGTSMVASVLENCGLHLGNLANKAVYEDLEIATRLEGGNEEELRSFIDAKNEAFAKWGFKRPEAFRILLPKLDMFRNPRLVVVFRDPAAIAKRNEISMHLDFADALARAAQGNLDLVEFCRSASAPTLVVSYEKAMSAPERFVTTISEFCGMEPSQEQRQAALSAMSNGPALYLKSSRVWYQGFIDRVSNRVAYGWARRMPGNAPVKVQIYSGDKLLGEGLANEPRPDLKDKVGDRAFAIKLRGTPGDEISAKVAGTTHRLERGRQFRME